jgi:hypothetical protein
MHDAHTRVRRLLEFITAVTALATLFLTSSARAAADITPQCAVRSFMSNRTTTDRRVILIALATDAASSMSANAFCDEATKFRPNGEGFATMFGPVDADDDLMRAAGYDPVCVNRTTNGGAAIVVWARRSIPDSWDSGNWVCGAMSAIPEHSAVELAEMVSRAVG